MIIQPKYQTFVKRIIANFIDGLVFIPFNFIGEYLTETFGRNAIIPWAFLDTLMWTTYYVFGHGKYGQTLGKKAMAIKVLDIDEKNVIGYKRAFIRESVWFFWSFIGILYYFFTQTKSNSSIFDSFETSSVEDFINYTTLGWFLLELFTMMFNSKRRAIHDFLAKSVVIDIDEQKKEEYYSSLETSP